MGVCCNSGIKEKIITETSFPPDKVDNSIRNSIKDNDNIHDKNNIGNNNHYTSEEKLNILESNKQLKNWEQQKDTLINRNNTSLDKPDVIDEVMLDNKVDNSLNILLTEEHEFSLTLIKMEKTIFDLINELRSSPKSFIDKIEKYKHLIKKENDKNYIIIDENEFIFEDVDCFDECIDFLKKQKNLEKFEKNQTMFECKKIFLDKNVGDLLFVVIYNLIDINNPEDNKIRRNCIMSEEYNKCNITISKEEFGNKLYSYYFSFDNI